ncbi:MAG: glycosyltransferase family 39 protein [bacterium]|nr:glycosyltransferase family 39 protein [bacterium]
MFRIFTRFLRSQYFLLSLIVALGFLVRLYKIDNPIADWHSWRQADTASVTRIFIERGIDPLHPRYHDISFLQTGKFNPSGWRFVEFPIFNIVHAIFVRSFPQFSLEMWGRLVSVISSTFSIFLIFLLGRRFLGFAGGTLSAFFFAFIPFNIYFSRVILPEAMSVTFALLALVIFTWWFDTGKRQTLFWAGIAFALSLLIKPYTIFYAVPMLWLIGKKFSWQWRKMFNNRELWVFAGLSFLPLIGWRIWMLQYPEGIPFYSWVFNGDGIRFRPSFWRWIFGERLGRLILGGWGTTLFVSGLLAKARKAEFGFIPALALGMFAYVSVIATANVRHDYYQTLVIPAVALVLARGVLFLWESEFTNRLLTRLLVVVVIVWTIIFPFYEIRELYKVNHPELLRAGTALDNIAPKDALVVAPYNGDTAFLYQTKRSGWPYQTNSIEELISFGADYYISVNLNDPQTLDVMRKFEIPAQTDEYVIVDLGKHRQPTK